MSGDDLAVRLFVGAAALAVLGLGVSQAGWTHKVFVGFLFVVAAILGAIAIFWVPISEMTPVLREEIRGIATSPIWWFGLMLLTLVVIFVADLGTRLEWFGSAYVETSIRLEREPGSSINYRSVKEHEKNIYTWKQVYFRSEIRNLSTGESNVRQVDNFFVVLRKKNSVPAPSNKFVWSANPTV